MCFLTYAHKLTIAFLLIVGIVGCQSIAASDYKLAVLTGADETLTEEIRTLIAKSLKYPDLKISKQPFTQSSYLYVTNPLVIDKSGGMVDIGDKADPTIFKLFKLGASCYLQRKDELEYWLLSTQECSVKE